MAVKRKTRAVRKIKKKKGFTGSYSKNKDCFVSAKFSLFSSQCSHFIHSGTVFWLLK